MMAAQGNAYPLAGPSLRPKNLAKLSQLMTNDDINSATKSDACSANNLALCLTMRKSMMRKAVSYTVGSAYYKQLKNLLPRSQFSDYAQVSSAKSGDRIGVLAKYKATHDAPSVFFCVLASVHPFFSDMVIIRVAHEVMVGWMGAEKSAPVTLYAGYANPVQLTTSEIGVSGGGIKSQYKEAATMATTLIQTTPKFEFRFLALSRADMMAKPCRVSVQAVNEKEARRVLAPHFILSLAACLPVQEVSHA
ncbi:host cell division inhibitor Icd-like protein [Chimaeribacter coloradensis]|uniref:host cell division inhibitor Icd-like protein n=1 Tax=Chimaeribacter coloradensis TaxID=2060068 RepID=UPI001F4D717B|nr:host cell division inhibitor Icd-like protein [Chimaeribacter coloradensis]